MSAENERAVLLELGQALAEERDALLGHDIDAVLASTQRKQTALERTLRLDRQLVSAAPEIRRELERLAEANRRNGELLAQRRRAVHWSLTRLGRVDQVAGYTARGMLPQTHLSRSIGRS
jgi:flagellar biosynthesis/type III secretory pathway chaperone